MEHTNPLKKDVHALLKALVYFDHGLQAMELQKQFKDVLTLMTLSIPTIFVERIAKLDTIDEIKRYLMEHGASAYPSIGPSVTPPILLDQPWELRMIK
jgi:hypothetical protein